jgi:hypothetical protein
LLKTAKMLDLSKLSPLKRILILDLMALHPRVYEGSMARITGPYYVSGLAHQEDTWARTVGTTGSDTTGGTTGTEDTDDDEMPDLEPISQNERW